MPISIDELLQLMYFDETSITLVQPGDIVVWDDNLYHVARIKTRKGQWTITGSWGEELTGRVRTGAGVSRVLRIPRDWLVRSDPPIVRKPPESNPAEEKPAKREIDSELLLDIFRP